MPATMRLRAVRRHRHRRRPQRPDRRRLPRARRAQGARPRAPPRPRRRGGHRGGLPGLPVLRLLVRRLAAAARDHPRARPAAARPRDPAARRHVHADAERRLPVAHQRPRAARGARSRATRGSTPRPTTSTARRWSRWAASSSRSSACCRPTRRRSIRAGSSSCSSCVQPLPAALAAGPVQPGPADDDERGRLPRSVVRDRRAQGDDGGVGHHRHVPRRALAGHGVRAAAPLHGRDRRRVPIVGTRARRHRRDLERHRRRGARGGRRDPHRGRRSRRSSCAATRRRGVVLENGDEIARERRRLERRSRG